jgi:hypothetical protein
MLPELALPRLQGHWGVIIVAERDQKLSTWECEFCAHHTMLHKLHPDFYPANTITSRLWLKTLACPFATSSFCTGPRLKGTNSTLSLHQVLGFLLHRYSPNRTTQAPGTVFSYTEQLGLVLSLCLHAQNSDAQLRIVKERLRVRL